MAEESCTWTESDGDNNYWDTECGEAFIFTDGTPESNGMIYCCFCGKPIIQEALEVKEEEDENEDDTIGG